MTSDWKVCKIEDITDILGDGLHGTPKYTEDGKYAFVNGNNLVNGHIEIKPDTKRVAESEYLKYKKTLNDRTLLVSINGTLGNVAEYNNEKIILGKSACYFNVKKNVSKTFIKYILISKTFQNYLENNATGTTIKNISLKQMREYEFLLPPLETQQKIARVLSAIDDKIELNNSINKNLEQQAQCYFDEIISKNDNIPYSEIGNICDVKGGKRLPKGVNLIITPNSHPYIRVRDLNNICVAQLNNEYEYVDDETQKSISRYIVNSNDVIISIVGTIGLTAIIGETLNNANLTENCVKLTNLKQITPEFLLLFLRSKIGQELINKSTVGAVQAKLPIKNIQSIKVPILSDKEFNEYINSIFKNIANNILENNKLIQLRDTLLPKLMNGEIDVDKVEV